MRLDWQSVGNHDVRPEHAARGPDGTPVPRRALVVSAAVGEGHNSAGRALEETMTSIWPGCQVRWLDTLTTMGPGTAPAGRAFYATQVQHLPWLYEFFFTATWQQQWFLRSTRRFIGSWCGRRMASEIRSFDPDVIVCTYPLGSAGLSWLRQHRRLDMPAGAWVPSFWPHPYWLYRNLDVTFVMHPTAVPIAARGEPGARIAVGALPVRSAFAPAGRRPARARLGLDGDRFAVVLCTGSLGLGGVSRAVTAVLAAGPEIQAIAICGHNDRLRGQLEARGEPASRLRVVGWTDDMPSWMTASDVVVTNAGGATALEALASSRPLIMFEPIAGHGRANARLLTTAGVAVTAGSPAELTAAIRQLAGTTAQRREDDLAEIVSRRREDDLAALASMPGRGPAGPYPVSAEDALFLHVQTDSRPQQVGAVVMLNGRDVSLAGLRSSVATRAAQIPQLRRRLLPPRGRWDRARWLVEDTVDVHGSIKEVTAGSDGTPASLEEVVSDYFADALDPSHTPWQLLLVHSPEAPSAIVVKVHHALGDSYALISALGGLFDPQSLQPPRAAGPGPSAAHGAALLATPRHVLRVARGLLGLSLARPPRETGIKGGAAYRCREFAMVSLDSRTVTVTARHLGASSADLVLAMVAEGLGRLIAARGERAAGQTVRAMVPSTLRAAGHGLRPRFRAPGQPPVQPRAAEIDPDLAAQGALPGNRTTGLLLDLPVGPMSLPDRVAAVQAVRQARLRRGDADAAAFVLHSMRLMPPPLQRAFARRSFTSKRFNLIVSIFPGVRRTCYLLGTEVTAVFPVLALASGVGVAVGAMTWGQSLCIGLMTDPDLIPDAALLAGEIEHAFTPWAQGSRTRLTRRDR
jgi:diacylglycerol O-acyltransferase / wax synthase